MSAKEDNPELQADSSDTSKVDSTLSASTSDTSSKPANEEKKSSSGILKFLAFLVIVIAIVAGGLASNGELAPLIESAKSSFNEMKADLSSEAESDAMQETESEAEAESAPKQGASETGNEEPEFASDQSSPEPVETQLAPEQMDKQPTTGPSSEQVEGLLATINSLRVEIHSMEENQRVLREELLKQQQANLQARLRWITDPASRLAQIQQAWEEISTMQALSTEQRDTAEKMHALARDSGEALQGWHEVLIKWGDALSTPVREDVLPQPEHPWLAWLVSQFHLRPAPSAEMKQLASLRDRLLMIAHQLTLENLPIQTEWQALRAELLLQATDMQKQNSNEPIELGLPNDFSAIQSDIQIVRDTAARWAQAKEGGV